MKEYDIIIVGAGITGASLLYTLTKFTDIERIAIIEKYDEPGQVSSQSNNNSQTLHFGDIETNYSLEKAEQVKEWASMLANYMQSDEGGSDLYRVMPKMALAVGQEEVDELEERFEEFRELFPQMRFLRGEEIAEMEPKVVEGRDPDVALAALYAGQGYAMNFGLVTKSFIDNAKKTGKKVDFLFGTQVTSIEAGDGFHKVFTDRGTYKAKVVDVAAAGHSYYLAKKAGFAKNYAVLPVAGTFYFAPSVLNGKVYMMQIDKLPFAAVHGDQEVTGEDATRFGPIARIMPMLERKDKKSFFRFFSSFASSWDAWKTYFNIVFDRVYLPFVFKSVLYDLPLVGRHLFIKQVKKIVPTLKASDLRRAKGYGEIRPQIANTDTKSMDVGSAKIVDDNIIFNITPSPGASVCLANAYEDTKQIIEFLGGSAKFDEKRFRKSFIDKQPEGYP